MQGNPMATLSPDEMLREVQASLENSQYACTSLTKLTGGTANFVYRGSLVQPLQDGNETVVIKHTEPYSASNTSFKLSSTRCDFEQTILTALQALPPVSHSGITVQTPKIYSFSLSTNTQIYSDLPDSTELKTYVLTHALTESQCSRLGCSLGKWAKAFHEWAAAPAQKEVRESMKGNTEMKELKYMINYTTLVATIANFPSILGECKSVFEAIAMDVRERLDNEEGSLIHGDFWSGNVLLKNAPFPELEEPLKLFVIDWELSHLSDLVFDLGQMFAELFELKHFKDIDAGIWLIEGFMKGYGKLNEDMAFRAAIHVGVHLICWGSRVQGWGSKEQVEKVVEVGRGFVVNGWEKDRRYFEGTLLKCLFA
ncbi:4-hydroxytryptamine kinase psiK [Lachnellula suecica]|uniref:4-hydroxytryptamine kinase psiK n=1 Tax=Lachnellula suecica TaxID=602035 RepID=A0A8T9CKJ3_9HELO|nr:4-hydroxytryptamine kinase psiK [Lachnellula suecica]